MSAIQEEFDYILGYFILESLIQALQVCFRNNKCP